MSVVEAVASWFTPTFLFCVLNIMIGTVFIASTLKTPHKNDEQPPQLIRVPSFFERVKSFNLSRSHAQQPDPAHPTVVPAEEEVTAVHRKEEEEAHHEAHHVTRSKSAAVAAGAKVLQKSASEKVWTEREDVERRRPATMREKPAGEDEAVDEKADDFINRFRQQLRLQRMGSLLRGMGR